MLKVYIFLNLHICYYTKCKYVRIHSNLQLLLYFRKSVPNIIFGGSGHYNLFDLCVVNILFVLQFPDGVSAVLCHYHVTQPVAAPGGSQDGGAFGRWTAKDGPPSEKVQPKVPGHHHRLPAAAFLRQSGEQGVCPLHALP